MDKPVAILSMPNSGSDWLAATLYETQPQLKYFREFFNPATNSFDRDKLLPAFGCEYTSCYRNIFSYDSAACEQAYADTWAKRPYTFTKENYSAFKVPFFASKFNCIGLVRSVHMSLPASRDAQVSYWYDAIFNSILENRGQLSPVKQELLDRFLADKPTFFEQNVFAFAFYQKVLEEGCREQNIKVLDYSILMQGNYEELMYYLKPFAEIVDVDRWVRRIGASRRPGRKRNLGVKGDEIIAKYFSNKML